MPDYTPLSFVGPDVDPKTRIALSMIQQGMDTSPIRSWTQGASRVAQSMLGALMLKDQQASQKDAMSGIVNGLLGQGQPAPDMPASDASTAPAAQPTIPPAALSGAPMADTAAPMSGGILTGADTSLPRGLRNNNPLNIEAGSFTQNQPGFAGSDGRFAKFGSQDQGLGAADNLLQSYANRGLNTISGIVNRWAPPSDNNPTGAYAATVAKAVGVDPNAPLDMSNPALRQKIIGAMAQFENGKPLTQVASLDQSAGMMQPAPMGPTPPQMAQAAPASPQAILQPPPAGPQPNVTNVPVQQAQLPIGQSQPQGKPILAPPQAINPQIPDNVRQAIITAVNSPDPNARAMGMAMLQKYTQPHQYGFQTLPDGTIIRTDPQSGGVQPVYQANKPQFTTIGTDQFGNPIHGFVDTATQKVTPAGVAQGQVIGPGGQMQTPQGNGQNLPTGDAFLQTQPKPVADQVKALAEGRMAFPAGFALKSPYWQHMIQMVSQYDPQFDAVNYNARAKTRADFTSGKSAQSINALNTVIGHMQTLSDAADKLNNTSFPAYNSVANTLASATGDPRIKQFDATKKAVIDELTRVYRGSGGSEGDIKMWGDQISAANSPEQLHGVIGQIGDLLDSKLHALGAQYKQGMGTTEMPIQLVTPHAADALKVLRQRAGGAPTAPQATPQANTKTINGKTYVNQNGQWFEQ